MKTKNKLISTPHLSALARMFSSSVIKELASKGKSPLLSRLILESSIAKTIAPTAPISALFDTAFSILKNKNYRHEYIYKAALTHKILLGVHSINTASMLTEFRVSNSKADVVILNGTSTVYEIKSERDKLDRLQSQVDAYRKAFAKVNIITGENHLSSVIDNVPSDVGILLLTDRFQISTIRESIDNPNRVNSEVILDSLQLSEAIRILELYGIDAPVLPNTKMRKAVREKFIKLDPIQAHTGMVKILKESRNLKQLASLVSVLPESLKTAAFTTPLRKKDHAKLVTAMDIPLSEALNWN